MADNRGAASAPQAQTTSEIRNVVLVGPTGSGKTTLVESLLFAAGATTRIGRVEDGSTIGDVDPVAIKQHRSVGLSVATISWQSCVINLIDTPGYADYVGDLRAGLRAADAALFVIGSVDGVDAATQLLWDECESVGLPRAIVVTKMDKERADFEETVAVCQRVFTGGGGVLPLYLPIHANSGAPVGFIDLISTRIHEWSSGQRVERECDPEHVDLTDQARGDLIEAIITESEDESLMDHFLAGDAIETDTLISDLEKAVARGHFHPVIAHATTPAMLGTELVLDLIARGFPSPLEHPLPIVTSVTGEPKTPLAADPQGPLCAEVIKTTTDPYLGKLSIIRVFSGTLHKEQAVHVSGHFAASTGHLDHDLDERIGALAAPLGSEQRPLNTAIAGSIVSVSKLVRAETGDTLSAPEQPLLMESWLMPEPLLPIAIKAHSSADEERLSNALARVLAEDPTLRIDITADSKDAAGQVLVWCLGEAHAELIVDRLKTRFGVNVDAEEVRISLRETFPVAVKGTGRHVKQSGGHGQYAVCEITVEPLPVGGGFEFVDKVVGGAVPRAFISSVEKGIRHQLLKGVAVGYPVVDIRVTLIDGKAHSVDSSDMAFQMAGALALKDAATKTTINLLEPLMQVVIVLPEDYVGAVMSDLATRRGHVTGTTSIGGGRSSVMAVVPERELTRYAIDIRSLTHGTGRFTREAAGFAPMPSAAAKKILGG